eukprot:CAMPEP_0174381350 /NCGR_PEP_ID=MMETSP0811_2-20130205/123955_1 /TAXON_ID=73025 ORGANISM="Eutreptiella gymnastica-like, Strain CCMP1594" /NCGR_SAMPLE_ID=MMETSP0811_2 /ASSEMBLY_ACC=CAM_ASM_000667 /LENGTH=75 /DNA_ID=CAMNT_0015534463 /DNA_START=603 /DNA_END=830 /DNA_ORIENTATION=+
MELDDYWPSVRVRLSEGDPGWKKTPQSPSEEGCSTAQQAWGACWCQPNFPAPSPPPSGPPLHLAKECQHKHGDLG